MTNAVQSLALDDKIAAVNLLLERARRDFAPATFASSLGVEDMVMTDLIAKQFPEIEIFTLDTGRLPEETHQLMQKVGEHYNVTLRVYFPDSSAVEQHLAEHGANAFFRSIELRKSCCHIRKVEPLRRALAGKRAWITGLRRDQAASRTELPVESFDSDNGLYKFNPLADWKQTDVWDYIRRFDVPYNILHDRGYPSIGCAPCTRAITVGEDVRAGRWWWENADGKECGLHARPPLKGGVSAQANPSVARVK